MKNELIKININNYFNNNDHYEELNKLIDWLLINKFYDYYFGLKLLENKNNEQIIIF